MMRLLRRRGRAVGGLAAATILAAAGLFGGALPAQALTANQCLASSSTLYQETVMATFGSAFVLKCGKKDPGGFGLRHINEGHPYTSDLYACIDDVLAYGVDSPAGGNNRKRVIGPVDGAVATVVYLPANPPTRNSIVTAFTNGGSTNQWTVCKNMVG